jgi:hypothetical protein
MSWEPIDQSDPQSDEVIGDEAFDEMASAIEQVAKYYQRDLNRKPTMNEIVTTFKQALETRIFEVSQEGQNHELVSVKYKLKKISKRQGYKVGDILRGTLANGDYVFARVFEDHPSLGPHIGVYDSRGMDSQQADKIISKPLIVKITPIHHENLEDRSEWLVVGNSPLTKADGSKPRGPLVIAGDNNQLIAANYFYGLSNEAFYDVDDWIVGKPRKGL